jgi:hypothetical protein
LFGKCVVSTSWRRSSQPSPGPGLLAGHKFVNEDDVLKIHTDLLAVLLTYNYKQVHNTQYFSLRKWIISEIFDTAFCLSNLSISVLISGTAIRMHPTKCSAVKRILILHVTLFIKLNSCSQRQLLPNTDDINKACFLISRNFFFYPNGVTQHHMKRTRTAQSTSAGHVLKTPELMFLCF